MKKVLIIVRGAKPVRLKNKFYEKIRNFYFRKLTSDRGILDNDYRKLRKFLERDYDIVEMVKWNGEILNGDFSDAMLELDDLLKKHQKKKIDVIGISIGGLISQRVLIYNHNIKIRKLLLIGAMFREKLNMKNVKKIYNVYSEKDGLFYLANKILTKKQNPILKGKNVQNIILKNIGHNDLCRNKKLHGEKFKEEKLFELYLNLLLEKV
jgi:predicted esterase YcpF (UPF0227 family)